MAKVKSNCRELTFVTCDSDPQPNLALFSVHSAVGGYIESISSAVLVHSKCRRKGITEYFELEGSHRDH